MALSSFIVLMMCAWLSSATYSHLDWSDCGSDPAVTIQKIEVTPMPLVLPGPMQVTFQGQMNRSLESIEIRLAIKRKTWLLDLPIPCLFHVGSCTYETSCSGKSILDTMIGENWAGIMADMGRQIRTMVMAIPGLNTTVCPVPPATVNLQHYTINLPAVPSILSIFAEGDYSAKVTVYDKTTNRIFLCLNTHMTLRKKQEPCTGLFCG